MEDLENALFLDQIPMVWTNRAYPSLLGLGAWFSDLLLRIRELETWTTDFVVSIRNCIIINIYIYINIHFKIRNLIVILYFMDKNLILFDLTLKK